MNALLYLPESEGSVRTENEITDTVCARVFALRENSNKQNDNVVLLAGTGGMNNGKCASDGNVETRETPVCFAVDFEDTRSGSTVTTGVPLLRLRVHRPRSANNTDCPTVAICP